MTGASNHVQHLSSRGLDGKSIAAVLREFYGRELMRVDLVARDESAPMFFDATVASIGDATWAGCSGSAFETVRDGSLLTDGCDDVYLATVSAGLYVESGRDEFFVEPGGAVLMSKARAYRYINNASDQTSCVLVPRARLAALAPHIGEAPIQAFAAGTPGLDLFFGYARMAANDERATPEMRGKAADHLLQLMADIVGRGRDSGSGSTVDLKSLGDARLTAIKQSIRDRLTIPSLSLERIAAVHGISPRYVQRLFEREGDSFSDFVRRERLARAWLLLTDSIQVGRRVLSVAFECGFNDITTFNRAFRRAYGMTPSEARELSVSSKT